MPSPLAIAPPPPEAAFEKSHEPVHYANRFDDLLDVVLRIPRSWKWLPVETAVLHEGHALTILTIAQSNDLPSERLAVWCAYIRNEIHPADYLDAWIRTQGFLVHDMRLAPTPYGLNVDALVSRTLHGARSVHRLATIKDGERLYLLDGRANLTAGGNADTMQHHFEAALTSVQVMNALGAHYAEQFEWLAPRGGLRWLAPVSWNAVSHEDAPPKGSFSTLHRTTEDGPSSVISVAVGDETTADDLRAVSLGRIEANGLSLPRTPTFDTMRDEHLAKRVGTGWLSHVEGEFTLRTLEATGQGRAAFVTLVLPDRETRFEEWAIARRAFEIIAETIQPAR